VDISEKCEHPVEQVEDRILASIEVRSATQVFRKLIHSYICRLCRKRVRPEKFIEDSDET